MLQDLEETIEKTKEIADSDKEKYVSLLYDITRVYATETLRDLKEGYWKSEVDGALSTGYLFCLFGEEEKALEFFKKAIQTHRANKDEYSKKNSAILEYIVGALEEFNPKSEELKLYKARLEQEKENEKEKKEDLRKQIIHIESDLECEEGDLESYYSQGRRKQGELYDKIGEHEKAIEYYKNAIEADSRNWREETSIKNKLSIVDSYLALDDINSSQKEFMELMRDLFPNDIKLGDEIPDLFRENMDEFYPYFKKLGLEDYLEKVVEYAEARLENLKGLMKPPSKNEDSKEHWKRTELCTLSEILADYHVERGDYQKASDIFDKSREYLEYKNHLSRRRQAEFAIRAGNTEKARQLIKEDEEKKKEFMSLDDEKPFELTNLSLQLGEHDAAISKLGGYCDTHKACLVSGSYGNIYEVRRMQIDIMKKLIGKDYTEKLREYAKARNNIFTEPQKFAPLKDEGKGKKRKK